MTIAVNRYRPATHPNGNLGVCDTHTGLFVKADPEQGVITDRNPNYREPERDVRDMCVELNCACWYGRGTPPESERDVRGKWVELNW